MFRYEFIPKIVMVPIGQIEAAPFNPPNRTQAKNLAKLKAGILELMGIAYPLIVSSDMRLIDGHRRLEALRQLGATEVPVIILPLSLQQAYRVLNTTQMPLTAKEWATALSLGYFRDNLPPKVRRDLDRISDLLGEDGLELLIENDIAPGIVREAATVAKYVDDIAGRRDSPTAERHRQVLLWMINMGQQAAAKAAVSDRMSPGLLRYAIESNSALRSGKR